MRRKVDLSLAAQVSIVTMTRPLVKLTSCANPVFRVCGTPVSIEEKVVSIVRIGLAETDKFAQGYDAIFSKRTTAASKPRAKSKAKSKPKAKAKKTRKAKKKK
jgi:hypothetical protein